MANKGQPFWPLSKPHLSRVSTIRGLKGRYFAFQQFLRHARGIHSGSRYAIPYILSLLLLTINKLPFKPLMVKTRVVTAFEAGLKRR